MLVFFFYFFVSISSIKCNVQLRLKTKKRVTALLKANSVRPSKLLWLFRYRFSSYLNSLHQKPRKYFSFHLRFPSALFLSVTFTRLCDPVPSRALVTSHFVSFSSRTLLLNLVGNKRQTIEITERRIPSSINAKERQITICLILSLRPLPFRLWPKDESECNFVDVELVKFYINYRLLFYINYRLRDEILWFPYLWEICKT